LLPALQPAQLRPTAAATPCPTLNCSKLIAMQQQNSGPEIYTKAVVPLTDYLHQKFPQGIRVSDVYDELGRQYVDLVQEGGGVHGIALAGYTYMLEHMNIGFMKMAGTSAGSINTLLLNAVLTRREAEALKEAGQLQSNTHYYETRSEKVLEYLAAQNLSDFVDGHPKWRQIILNVFTPGKSKGIKQRIRLPKFLIGIAAAFLLCLLAGVLVLVFGNAATTLYAIAKPASLVSVIGFLGIVLYFLRKAMQGRSLYKKAEQFGVNPGDAFEAWLEGILKENGVNTVMELNQKLSNEIGVLRPHFKSDERLSPQAIPVKETTAKSHATMRTASGIDQTATETIAATDSIEFTPLELRQILERIKNPAIRVELLFDEMRPWVEYSQRLGPGAGGKLMNGVMHAFHLRLQQEAEKDPAVTKEQVIVSSDITHGLKVEFPGMHKMYWGDNYGISPARYVRASMSVPLFFKPMKVTFNGGQKHIIEQEWHKMLKVHKKLKDCALFVDGGLLSNFPINVFYDPARPVPRKPTFGIKLEYEDESESATINSWSKFAGSMINTMRYFYDRDFTIKHEQYAKTVRSIDTGKVHWLNFGLTEQEKVELFFRGALTATIFLAKHLMKEGEAQQLIDLGKSVPLNGAGFSIFGPDKEASFKCEDCLLSDVTFEWQHYKKERLLARVLKDVQREQLKTAASPKADTSAGRMQ
jgi:NTE family protein